MDFIPVHDGVDFSPVFSAEYYKQAYSDLQQFFGDDAGAYFQHFISYGISEGRQGKLDFSIREFVNQHSELKGRFGSDMYAYYHEVLTNPDYVKELNRPYVGMNVALGEPMEILHTAQKHNLILLKELDRFCEKHGLKYYMICGSMLGAFRHKNFVPWDDDVDVAMTRADFEKFRKLAPKELDPKEFMFLDYDQMGNNAFLDFMSRLVYMKEEVPINIYKKIRGKARTDIENHIPLDIYVLDNAFDNEKMHDFHTKAIQAIYGLFMGHRAFVELDEYNKAPEDLQKKIKMLIKIGRILPFRFLCWFYERVRRLNNRGKSDSYIMSNGFIFCIPWKFKKEWFAQGAQYQIGEDMFWGPKDAKAYLTKQYGDYMRLPAVENRVPTHTKGATGIFYTVDYYKGNEKL